MSRHGDRGRSFFILSSARSGSTSLARILDGASNGCCAVEPMPNLNVESRLAMEDRLPDAEAVLARTVLPRVRDGVREHGVYGEKNVTYGPFVRALHRELGCRFIHLVRDGRDVVRSLLDWHEQMFGNVYRECREPGTLSQRATVAAANLPAFRDTSDFARPRPLPGSRWDSEWEQFSRAEMCAYYWATSNELYLDELQATDGPAACTIDYTSPTAHDVLNAAEFCSLRGLTEAGVQEMLDRRINSVKDRTREERRSRNWTDWDGGERRRFERIAGGAMRRLGFWTDDATRWRPRDYGRWWVEHQGGLEWYTWMHGSRRRMHNEFIEWVYARERGGERLESIADFGCGLGVGYAEALADCAYIGVDLSERNIAWCRANRPQSKHQYLALDFIAQDLPAKADVVMSSGTIDNVYDADALLTAMVRNARRWIYLTAYRGWFPELREHRYSYREEHQCFYTDVSPHRLREHLESLGCRDITIGPARTDRSDICYETLVRARVPN